MSTVYFAWVEPTETTFNSSHERSDEDVFAFEIAHTEGDHAALLVDIINPRVGLLNDSREQWAWLSFSDDETDTTPIFFGRLVGVPEQLQDNIVRLAFTAMPQGFDETKAALADSLRVLPNYDPVWIVADRRDDPDSVLEGYPALFHVDRVTHVVTISDILTGEDGVIDLAGDFFHDSLDITYGPSPVRKVFVEGEVYWTQVVAGSINLTDEIVAAFEEAGTTKPYMISSITGEGLMADWPQEGRRIGGGWTVGESSIVRTDGFVAQQSWYPTHMVDGRSASFPVWAMRPEFNVTYEAQRRYSELVRFTLTADVQPLLTEPGEEETIRVTLASPDVDDLIGPADTDNPDGTMPIEDTRRRTYFNTERGRLSVEALIAIARARLLARARAVEIRLATNIRNGLALSCRSNVKIDDTRLPGGTATGKVMGYTLSLNGDTGQALCEIIMGCSIGRGDTVTAEPGEPSYVETGVLEPGIQVMTGQSFMPFAGEVTYEEFGHIPPSDDGLDFFDLRPADVIIEISVQYGETEQRELLDTLGGSSSSGGWGWSSLQHVEDALKEFHTRICVDLKPLNVGPFETQYDLVLSDLMVPKTIDLESASMA